MRGRMPLAWLAVLLKPLPALALAAFAWRTGGRGPRRLAAGLLLAAAGDVLLLDTAPLRFLAGMACFAAMHVCYILAYTTLTPTRPKPRPLVNAALTIAVAFTVVTLAPHAGSLALPLAIYSVLLATMVLFALDLIGRVNRTGAIAVAAGALAFMLSDTLLAFSMFYPHFVLHDAAATAAVLASYYLAQTLIALGVVNIARRG